MLILIHGEWYMIHGEREAIVIDPDLSSKRCERDYAQGICKPRYPVPAIREWYEWCHVLGCYRVGTDLFDEYIELVHMQQSVY